MPDPNSKQNALRFNANKKNKKKDWVCTD